LKEFDGQPVSGTYVLSFGLNELSTKFCNTLNGTLSITDTTFTVPALMSTKMFCTDEEANRLETAFTPDGAQFSIASTRMASDNLASLAITTTSGHLFLYTTPSL
jgi:hypothetical protein